MKKYKIKYTENGKIKELILKFEHLDINTLPSNIIEIKQLKYQIDFSIFKSSKLEQKSLILLFYELDLMLSSNIVFSDAIDILIKNKKDEKIIDFLKTLKFFFSSKQSVYEEFERFKLDKLILSFLEIIQKNGNIALNIKTLYLLLKEKEETKKDFIKAISYPLILFVSFFISLFSIFYFVIPKFKVIFSQNIGSLSFATKSLLFVENLFTNYFFYILLSISFIVILSYYLIRTNENIKRFLEKILVKKLYLIKDIYLNLQLYRVFLVISIMLKSNFEFYRALNTSKVLLKNNFLLDKISLIENLLYNGEKINKAFFKSDLFDDIVLNLINTGEVTNSLDIVVEEIKKIYKNRFDEQTKKLTSLIQPIFLALMMAMILWIVLAIFVPIWDMGNMIKV